ncbi:MAG: FAD-binding oxidoreductase [Mycobacteriales bacterium]
MRWDSWGVSGRQPELPPSVVEVLKQALHADPNACPRTAVADVRLSAPALPDSVRGALAELVGAEHVRTDRQTRLLHVGGKSTVDLLRCRSGAVLTAPDAVVLPADHEEVLAVLRCCATSRVAVVPFGGGTSVVGGLAPEGAARSAVIALDLRRMDRLVAVDEQSMTATLQPGLRGPDAEHLLAERGLTIGHFPQSFEHATIGGFAATRSSGQSSSRYGRFDDLVVALLVATPRGELRLGRAPASAAGPDLRELFLGSEGAFGVITEVTVRVRPTPEVRLQDAWLFASFEDGATALRRLAQNDTLPAVARLSDEEETVVNSLLSARDTGPPGGAQAILVYEGGRAEAAARRLRASDVLSAVGGTPQEGSAAQEWRRNRFQAPYLRDTLLDHGVLVDTLETASSWSVLPALYRAVKEAVGTELRRQGTPSLVTCHISHVYASGASLYFTVATAAAPDPISQWRAVKKAAGDAIVGCGATITHHHGVGVDHREWMTAEIGELGMAILRAVKDVLDPSGILNPGKLIPPVS